MVSFPSFSPITKRLASCAILAFSICLAALGTILASSQTIEYNEELEKRVPETMANPRAIGDQEFYSITADRKNDYLYLLGLITDNRVLYKYDRNGTLVWSKEYGTGEHGHVSSVLFVRDATYSVGFTGNLTHRQSMLLKHDEKGNLVWSKSIDILGPVAIDHGSGSLFVTGASASNALVQRYDTNGNLVWSRSWERGTGYSIDVYVSSVYVAGTISTPEGDERTFVLKYSLDGDLLWERVLDGIYANWGYDMTVYRGKVYVTGQTAGPCSGCLLLVAYDFDGNLLWNKTWEGVWGHIDGEELVGAGTGYDMAVYKRHLYVAGELTGAGDVLLQQYDLDGNLVSTSAWDCCDHKFIPTGHNRTGFDEGRGIVISGGHAYVAGKTFQSADTWDDSLLLAYNLRD